MKAMCRKSHPNKPHYNRRTLRNPERHGVPLPYCLRIGMERLSGLPLSAVRVFYNAAEPARVQAHAYAQGENIYLAPNQEHHLPHELGHVVQQKKGMVRPTKTVNGVEINDDPFLEDHATELGKRARATA